MTGDWGVQRGDTRLSIPGDVEVERSKIKVLELSCADLSSAFKPPAYCSYPEAREGTSAGDLMGFWG
jgi:hypothetical protein